MKKRSGKIIKHLLSATVLLLLLVSVSYAWIYGNTSPKLTGKFTIGDNQGLNFILNNKSVKLINLNSVFGIESESLNLNEVTSTDGNTFLARDTQYMYMEYGNPGTAGEILTFRPAENNSTVVQDGAETFSGDYLDVSFDLNLEYGDLDESENAVYYIYFLNGTIKDEEYFTGFSGAETTEKGLRALRTCLRVSGASGYNVQSAENTDYVMKYDSATKEYYAFFGNYPELGTEAYPYRTSAVASTEKRTLVSTQDSTSREEDIAGNYYISYLNTISSWPHEFGSTRDDIRVLSFDSCSIDPDKDGSRGMAAPNGKYLFRMDKNNHNVTVKLRVWLEGGSEYCVNSQVIPNDGIDLGMYFVAYKVTDSTEEEMIGRLPEGYTELEYIESTGTQYIDTGAHYLYGDEFYFKWYKEKYLNSENIGYGAGGSRAGVNSDIICGGGRTWNGTIQMWIWGNYNYSPSLSASTSYGKIFEEHWIIDGKLSSTLKNLTDNTIYTLTGPTIPASYDSANNIYLFRDSSVTWPYPSAQRVYGCWLKRQNGDSQFDLVPARYSDGTLGMYDLVSGTFLTNAGSGSFIAGPEVEY